MKLKELHDLCLDTIARFERGEFYGDKPVIMLVVPTKTIPRGNGIRLCGRTGPVGDWLSTRHTKSQLQPHEQFGFYYNNVCFDARKVLKYVEENALPGQL